MTRTVISPAVFSPVKAVIYLRLSDLKADDLDEHGNGKTFSSREQKLREFAKRLGWTIYKVIIENDVNRKNGKARNASAFKRRKVTLPDGTTVMRVVRPGFRETLGHLQAGRANGLLAEDLDRTMRDPRDLEDFIDIAEERKVNARSLSGSLTFTDGGTDAEITLARNMVSFANAASRATSRRVSDARERQAMAGTWHGGRRPFGFEEDGVTQIPAEAEIILDCSKRVIQLNQHHRPQWSLRLLAAELRDGPVPTVSGAPWSSPVLRSILLRPRNAGITAHNGVELGRLPGEAIVGLDLYRAVVQLLTDPSRNTREPGVGNTPRWLGTSLYLCGIHGNGTSCNIKSNGNGHSRTPRYRCKDANHLARHAIGVDTYVQATLLNRIERDPRFVKAFVYEDPKPEMDAAALRLEAETIRLKLDGLARDHVLDLIDKPQLHSATRAGRVRLEEIDRMLNASAVESPLLSLVGIENVGEVWQAQPLSTKRFVLDTLMEVTLNPPSRRGPRFDTASIGIRFREVGELEAAA